MCDVRVVSGRVTAPEAGGALRGIGRARAGEGGIGAAAAVSHGHARRAEDLQTGQNSCLEISRGAGCINSRVDRSPGPCCAELCTAS